VVLFLKKKRLEDLHKNSEIQFFDVSNIDLLKFHEISHENSSFTRTCKSKYFLFFLIESTSSFEFEQKITKICSLAIDSLTIFKDMYLLNFLNENYIVQSTTNANSSIDSKIILFKNIFLSEKPNYQNSSKLFV
jgi:hypothetical protein